MSAPQDSCNGQIFFTNDQIQKDLHTPAQPSLQGHEPINGGEWRGPLDSLAYSYGEQHATFCPTSTLGLSNPAFYYHRHIPPVEVQVIGSPLMDRGSQPPLDVLYPQNFSLQAVSRPIHRTDLPPVNDTVRVPFFETAPTTNRSHIFRGLASTQGYQVTERSRDDRTVTLPIGKTSPYPTTAYESLGGCIVPGTGTTSSLVHDLKPTIIRSVPVHRNETAASPNLLSTSQLEASYHTMASSSVASIRDSTVRRNRGTYSCHTCNANFVQRQGFNRHNRDKHEPRNICPHCRVFTWSPGRNYLFTKHLEIDHQEVTL